MAEELRPDRAHVVFHGLTDEGKKQTGAIAALIEDSNYYAFCESLQSNRIQSVLQVLKSQGKILIINGPYQLLIS